MASSSVLLGRDLEKSLHGAVSGTESVMCAGISRLYTCEAKFNGTSTPWRYTGHFGVVAFVCDRALDRYLFRMYATESESVGRLLFQYELHYNMEYRATLPYFHVFSLGDERLAAFCFALDRDGGDCGENALGLSDATKFYSRVTALKPRNTKSDEEMKMMVEASEKNRLTAMDEIKTRAKKRNFLQDIGSIFSGGRKKSASSLSLSSMLNGRKKSAAKIEIGEVISVKRTAHMSLRGGGIDLSQLPTEWQEVMKLAGVSESDMQDKDVVDAVLKTYKEVTGVALPAPAKSMGRKKKSLKSMEEEDSTTPQFLKSIAALEVDPRVKIHGWLLSLRRKHRAQVTKKWYRQYWVLYDGCFLVATRGPTFAVNFLEAKSTEAIDKIDMRGIESTTVVAKKVSKEESNLPGTGIKLRRDDGKAKVLCMSEDDGMVFIEWLTALGDSLKAVPDPTWPSRKASTVRAPPPRTRSIKKPNAPPLRQGSKNKAPPKPASSAAHNAPPPPTRKLGKSAEPLAPERKAPPPPRPAARAAAGSQRKVAPPPPRPSARTPPALPSNGNRSGNVSAGMPRSAARGGTRRPGPPPPRPGGRAPPPQPSSSSVSRTPPPKPAPRLPPSTTATAADHPSAESSYANEAPAAIDALPEESKPVTSFTTGNPLLASIRNFDASALSKAQKPEAPSGGRANMLSMISGFNKSRLKKTNSAPKAPSRTITSEETHSIADMLKLRMANVRRDIIDEEDDFEEESEDDWSDDDDF